MLDSENSSATEQYAALVEAKDHAASTTLPVVRKNKQLRHSNIPEELFKPGGR